MKKYILFFLLISLALTLLFREGQQNKLESNPIQIGLSTVLTGDFAAAGQNMVDAAKLAVEKINKEGGINGRSLALVIEDAGWESKTGLSATQKLTSVNKIKYIIGGTSSNGTMASAPVVNKERVVYITPVTGGGNVDNAGEYIFRLANSDLLAGKDIALAMKKLGYENIGVIAEVTEYTLDLKKTFEESAKKLGMNVVFSEEFYPNTTNFNTIVTKAKRTSPDAIFVVSQTGLGGGYFIKQAKEVGLKSSFFSDFTFVTNSDAKKLIGSFDGIYFADPAYDETNPETINFLSSYQAAYNKSPLIPFHALATYDSIVLLSKALKSEGDDSVRVHDWLLQNVKNYQGLMGTYSLDDKGNSDLGFDIKIIKSGIPVKI